MNNIIYNTAFWLRSKFKSTTLIKISILFLLISFLISIFTTIWVVLSAMVVITIEILVLEFLYAMNEEVKEGEGEGE